MLMTWERKILRKIYGPTEENGQWRIKTNEELRINFLFSPMPSHVLMNFRGFPPVCGDSVAYF